jgi:hypothetical protein
VRPQRAYDATTDIRPRQISTVTQPVPTFPACTRSPRLGQWSWAPRTCIEDNPGAATQASRRLEEPIAQLQPGLLASGRGGRLLAAVEPPADLLSLLL